jgi:hypothetical protein
VQHFAFDRMRSAEKTGSCQRGDCTELREWRITNGGGTVWFHCERHKLAAEAAMSPWMEEK